MRVYVACMLVVCDLMIGMMYILVEIVRMA